MMLENGVRNIAWAWFSGGIGSTAKMIKLPADVDGLKLRAAGKKFEFMMREAGASITSMPSSEVYQAIATGVLNTVLTSAASFVSYRLYEQLKYANVPTKYAIWFMAENLCISEKTVEADETGPSEGHAGRRRMAARKLDRGKLRRPGPDHEERVRKSRRRGP